MSILGVFYFLFTLLVTTQSSAIKERFEDRESPIAQGNDEVSSLASQMKERESEVVVPEQTASTSNSTSTYCSQFGSSCPDCIKERNCTLVRYTSQLLEGQGVEETTWTFKCWDDNTPLKTIQNAYEDTKVEFIKTPEECPKVTPRQNSQENDHEGISKAADGETTAKATSDLFTSASTTAENKTTTAENKTTTATTKTTASLNTTVTTPATTTTASSSTTHSTSTTTESTTSKSTSATNSTQTPITSKDPPPPPSSGGWSFWSFFGGILLTLGLSAIGFVGFKYYKARSSQPGGGLNYNRF